MNSALFTYRRRVVVNNVESYNDNFINPLNVGSFYWQEVTSNSDGKIHKQLSVFLNNNYSITFVESIGKKFVDHMEEFLRFIIWGPVTTTSLAVQQTNDRSENRSGPGVRRIRRPIDVEVVEDIPASPESEWVAGAL